MDGQAISNTLQYVYQKLWERYGPQHWWPAREPFEVIVGAILTQSTAWANVEKAINNLRAAMKLSPAALRQTSHSELAGLIRPCGYYNVKAARLKSFANWFGEGYNDSFDKLFAGDIDGLRQRLLAIYGIGEETADSILLYAGNKPAFVIDAYTRRIIGRLGLAPPGDSYAAYQELFTAHLPSDARLFNEYHALLVCLAKDVCRKHPVCQRCCLNPADINNAEPSSVQFPCSAISRTDK
jgi:endonuclease-3 related protein